MICIIWGDFFSTAGFLNGVLSTFLCEVTTTIMVSFYFETHTLCIKISSSCKNIYRVFFLKVPILDANNFL